MVAVRRNPAFAGLEAEKWARENGITQLPIKPKEIAASLDIVVDAKPDTAEGVSGMLCRHGDTFGILYATHVRSEGFQNFSIAHEIGHYLLPGHPEQLFSGGKTVHESHAGFVSNDPFEAEADHFAAALLMPDFLFDKAMRRAGDGLRAIETLARRCETSLTATAIRFVQRTPMPVAVVVSAGQHVDYCFMSKAMQEFEGLTWPRKGDPLPGETATERFARDAGNILQAHRCHEDGDLRDWFGHRKHPMEEEVLGLGAYGKALTVISANVLDDDEVNEDETEDAWTPRFRR